MSGKKDDKLQEKYDFFIFHRNCKGPSTQHTCIAFNAIGSDIILQLINPDVLLVISFKLKEQENIFQITRDCRVGQNSDQYAGRSPVFDHHHSYGQV